MGPTALPQQWSPPLGIFSFQASSLGGIGGGVLHFQVLCLLHFWNELGGPLEWGGG